MATAREIGETLRRTLEGVAKALTLEVDKELRRRPPLGTPVDTGHARAGWMPSVLTPRTEVVDGSATHQTGVASVMRFKLEDGVLWVSNPVDYVPILNLGWSDQSPAMFIEQAVDRATATIQARYNGRIDIGRAQLQSAFGAAGAEGLAASYSPFGDDE